MVKVNWRGQAVFIVRRSPEMMKQLEDPALSDKLRDPIAVVFDLGSTARDREHVQRTFRQYVSQHRLSNGFFPFQLPDWILATADGGTEVVQRREAPKGISDVSVRLTKAVLGGVDGFTTELQQGMNETLRKIKRDAEAAR